MSFADELWISSAAKRDWPYFARWHYRSHNVGLSRYATLLWHGGEPIGYCLFISPPLSLSMRNRFFGHSGKWSREAIRVMNSQLVMLSRVVIHPTYRAAGISTGFVRRSCELCPWPWIETLTALGNFHPFFEKAGFIKVGASVPKTRSRESHSKLFGGKRKHGRRGLVTQETFQKSEFSQPVYYIFDNRKDSGQNHQTSNNAE